MDHGVTNPTACAWWAITPAGDAILYREYYKKGATIAQNVQNIVKLSGNRIEQVEKDPPFHVEKMERERFLWTLLDWHVWEPEAMTQRPIADEYIRQGLNVRQSSRAKEMSRYEAVRRLLEVDPTRKHPVLGVDGAPRLYVFRSCRWFLWEISRYTWDRRTGRYMTDRNPKERARDRDNHLMDCMEYMAVENPAWFPPEEIWSGDYSYKPVVSSATGY